MGRVADVRWYREPALHFVVIGALLFAADQIAGPSTDEDPVVDTVIEIDAEKLDTLRRDWLARTGRSPDAETLDALVDQAVEEEILFREARAMNLHRLDSLVRRRLVQNMRFVDEGTEKDDDALFEEALALGMDRSDIVVRRRLVQIMQLRAKSFARRVEPTQAELADYLERNAERYERRERVQIAHVYLSRDRRGDALDTDAVALLAELSAAEVSPDRASEFGDPFLFPDQLPSRSERELAKTFGPDFARAVIALHVSPARWRGPYTSAYGQHLVWVYERVNARCPELAEVEREVREAVLEERGREELRRLIGELRTRYTVQRIDGEESVGRNG